MSNIRVYACDDSVCGVCETEGNHNIPAQYGIRIERIIYLPLCTTHFVELTKKLVNASQKGNNE